MLNRYRRHRHHSTAAVFGYFMLFDIYSYSLRRTLTNEYGLTYLGPRETIFELRNISMWFFNETKCCKLDGRLRSELFHSVTNDTSDFYIPDIDFFFSSSYVYYFLRYGWDTYTSTEFTRGFALLKFTRNMKLMEIWKYEISSSHAYYRDIFFDEFGSKGYEDRSGTYSRSQIMSMPASSIASLVSKKIVKRPKHIKRIYPRFVSGTPWENFTKYDHYTLTAEDIPEKSIIRHLDLPISFTNKSKLVQSDLVTMRWEIEFDGKIVEAGFTKHPY